MNDTKRGGFLVYTVLAGVFLALTIVSAAGKFNFLNLVFRYVVNNVLPFIFGAATLVFGGQAAYAGISEKERKADARFEPSNRRPNYDPHINQARRTGYDSRFDPVNRGGQNGKRK
ncbi:MAG: hypothetical protein LBQ40_03045 [Clostridiales bacterium]|jgi:hypothetical protein|nr:hypothetical protein [Clostridiales bacterium]